MRMRSEMVMGSISVVWSRNAAVEPLLEHHRGRFLKAQRLIERIGLHILAADQELQLQDARVAQPAFRRCHDDAAKAELAAVGIDGDVIDPAAMTVMADHDGGYDRATVAADQDRRVVAPPGHRDVGMRIVPGPRQAAALPERDHRLDVGIRDRSDREGGGSFVHSTFPGFMIPSGSSIALICRISSIAVLSFTSGNSSRLSTPMPCSAEIEPPKRSTIANTTAFISCQRARYSALSAPMGWLTL